MEGKGLLASIAVVVTIIVGFFQLADSPTFQTYVWQPLSEHTVGWSADDWKTVGNTLFGLLGGVYLLYLAIRGLALGALRRPLWLLSPVPVFLVVLYKHAKWLGWW
jgi:hypothetical protein